MSGYHYVQCSFLKINQFNYIFSFADGTSKYIPDKFVDTSK